RCIRATLEVARAQEELANETANLGEKKLTEVQVFARMVQKSGEAMKQGTTMFKQRVAEVRERDPDDRPGAPQEAVNFQKEALRRLDQLLEALKQEPGLAMRPPGGGG